MVKLPYGVFDPDPPEYPDAWSKLSTIAEYLKDGETLPCDLARWLADAIYGCGQNESEFLKLLGLKKRRGKQPVKFEKWYELAFRVDQYVAEHGREGAIAKVLEEENDQLSRGTLQNYYRDYLKANKEYRKIE